MTILERYQSAKPDTAKANFPGKDKTPIGDDNPREEFSPTLDLSKDDSALARARGGSVNTKKYSDTVTRD